MRVHNEVETPKETWFTAPHCHQTQTNQVAHENQIECTDTKPSGSVITPNLIPSARLQFFNMEGVTMFSGFSLIRWPWHWCSESCAARTWAKIPGICVSCALGCCTNNAHGHCPLNLHHGICTRYCYALLLFSHLEFRRIRCDLFTHILQGCFAGSGSIPMHVTWSWRKWANQPVSSHG